MRGIASRRLHAANQSGTFAALQVSAYRVLWFGGVFSFLGMQMQMIARGYLAFDLTGRNTALGGVMIAFGVPQLLLGLWGGVVADRLAKRNVLVLWQSAIALGSGLMAVAIAADQVAYWMLIASSVLNGAAFAFIGPARLAFVGDLVPERMMGNAFVLQQVSMSGTRVFGPALAGVLIATPFVGMAGVYLLTTLGFLIAVVTMSRLPPGQPLQRATPRSPLGDIADGLRYVRANRPLAVLLLMSFTVVALAFPYEGFLASVVRSEFGRGAAGLGAITSLGAVGALGATLAVAALTGHRHAWRIQALMGAAFGVALLLFSVAPSFAVGLVVMLFVGAFASGFQSLNNALAMTLADRRYYGRVQALMGMSWSFFGIMSLPLGMLADLVGIRTALAFMGAAAVVCIGVIQLAARLAGVQTRRHEGTDIQPVNTGEAAGILPVSREESTPVTSVSPRA